MQRLNAVNYRLRARSRNSDKPLRISDNEQTGDKWSPRRSIAFIAVASVLAWAGAILITGLLFIGAFRLADMVFA